KRFVTHLSRGVRDSDFQWAGFAAAIAAGEKENTSPLRLEARPDGKRYRRLAAAAGGEIADANDTRLGPVGFGVTRLPGDAHAIKRAQRRQQAAGEAAPPPEIR